MTTGTGIGATYSSRDTIGRFYARLADSAPAPWVGGLSMRIDSSKESESYAWLGMTPAMREWVGGRAAAGFRSNTQTVVNKLYEATIDVNVDDLRRDKTGQFMRRIEELAVRAQEHREDLLSAQIIAGEATACYDGQFFFDTDHAEGDSGTQSNDITFDISDNGTSGTATAPLANTIVGATLAGVQAIWTFKDDKGKPMNRGARNFTVMVPATYGGEATKALTQPLIGGGDSNVLLSNAFNLQLVVNPYLTWTTKLAVFNTDSDVVKPFIEQVEFDPEIAAIAEGSELEINDRLHRYTVTRSGAMAFGFWQKACLITIQA